MAWHNGKWWPLYVPDWYHPRVSQHFFDPYSFLHILHGFIFFGLWGWWPGLVWGVEWWWVWVRDWSYRLTLETGGIVFNCCLFLSRSKIDFN